MAFESEIPDAGFVDAMYRAHAPGLLRLAFVLTGSRQAAEDLVHDAFSRSMSRLSDVDDPAPYLRRSVINAARSSHRRRSVAERHAMPSLDHVDDHELTEFSDALGRLPIRQRSAVVLRYLYQLHDDDIADALGCRRSTVRTLVQRGLTSLRKELT